MRWFPTSPAPASSNPRAEITESIRAALLETLKDSATPGARTLMQRIQYASDAERLWYLRPEAMSVLASLHGEAHARETLTRITPLFQDVLPEGLASKLRAGGSANSPVYSRRPDTFEETA